MDAEKPDPNVWYELQVKKPHEWRTIWFADTRKEVEDRVQPPIPEGQYRIVKCEVLWRSN